MAGNIIGGQTEKALLAAMNGLSARQRVIGSNIANVDTPGFKGAEVNFETALKQAMGQSGTLPLATTNSGHIDPAPSGFEDVVQIVPTDATTLRNDGNNVDIDREMSKLAETTVTYDALSQLMSMKLSLWKTIINEGRR